MNVTCSHCHTIFRVDPHKVPAEGVRARCSVCRGVFPVEASRNGTGTGAAAAAVAAPSESAQPQTATEAGTSSPAASEAASAAPEPRSDPDSASQTAAPAPGSPRFGAQDPHSKARRLARALVSDMVIYHPERQERGLREGTLRKDFKEEIRKSWEEFVEQVGREIAHGTPYFRDALNEILARGQKVF